MDHLIPWNDLLEFIIPYFPEYSGKKEAQQLKPMLRTFFIQQWFNLSATDMEEAFLDIPLYREFAFGNPKAAAPEASLIEHFEEHLGKYFLDVQILAKVKNALAQQGTKLQLGHLINATLNSCQEDNTVPSKNPSNVHIIKTHRHKRNLYSKVINHTEETQTLLIANNDSIKVHIAPDEMSATIRLSPVLGSYKISEYEIMLALQDAGVIAGIDTETIQLLISNGSTEDTVIALGTEPVDGTDTEFKTLVAANSNWHIVNEGEPLIRRIPATSGVHGITVTGKTLFAQSGQKLKFAENMSGTRISEIDSNLLLADVTGKPIPIENGMKVEPVLRVAEVNAQTGSIHFSGSVIVDGDVQDDVSIQATGDIMVGGSVAQANLKSGRDIVVKGGVTHDARLYAEGTVYARSAQSSTLQAGLSIDIDEMALQCYLTARENITVGLKIPHQGSLVGGIARAMKSIKAPYIGYYEGGITRIIVGVDEELENQFRNLQFAIEDKQANVESHLKIINLLNKIGDPRNIMQSVCASLEDAEVKIKELENQSKIIDDKLALLRKSKVEVLQEASDTVEVTIANHKVRLTKKYGRGFFGLSEENRLVHIYPKGTGLAQ